MSASRARAWAHKRRFGWPGTEPAEVRRPVQRWGSQLFAIAALFVSGAGSVEGSAALALVALILAVPRQWSWQHDRLSALLWTVGAATLAAGAIAYLVGGHAARGSFGAHGQAGAAALLVFASTLAQIACYFRRWGTSGNVYYTAHRLRAGDPAAADAVRQRASREGYRPEETD
jgi:hypothetical protein